MLVYGCRLLVVGCLVFALNKTHNQQPITNNPQPITHNQQPPMKVYTKTGDKGQTSLVGGKRVSKCCERLESYGTVDELNSHIGVLITYCSDRQDIDFLTGVQANLFVVGGYLATDNSEKDVRQGNIVTDEMISAVEKEIDRVQELLPPLRLFILPGGSREIGRAHV